MCVCVQTTAATTDAEAAAIVQKIVPRARNKDKDKLASTVTIPAAGDPAAAATAAAMMATGGSAGGGDGMGMEDMDPSERAELDMYMQAFDSIQHAIGESLLPHALYRECRDYDGGGSVGWWVGGSVGQWGGRAKYRLAMMRERRRVRP